MSLPENEVVLATPPRRKPGLFDWTVNLGHVFIVLSLFISAAGLYAHDEARMAVIETKVDQLTQQNLPPRVAALETQARDTHDVLVDIRNLLAGKADKQK